MRRENYKSDLRIAVQLFLGNEPIPVPEHDFILRFSTSCFMTSQHYDCKHVGDEWINCYEEDGKVICCLNNHKFSPGRLHVEYFDYVPASDFPDGNMLKVVPRCLDIELISCAGDDAALISAEVAIDVAGAIADAKQFISAATALMEDLEAKRDADYWRGEQGDTGAQGEKGEKGDKGDKGDAGEKGDTFTYSDMTEQDKEDLASHIGLEDYYTKSEIDAAKQDITTLVDVSSTGDVSQALDPYKWYRFGTVDSLTLTLVAPAQGKLGEYGGKFTASADWSALSVPQSVDDAKGNDTIAAGKTYEFNIADNVIIVKEV